MLYCSFCYKLHDLDEEPDEGICTRCKGPLCEDDDPPKEKIIENIIKELLREKIVPHWKD